MILRFFQSEQSEAPEALLGGRYKVLDQLSAGGFGQTFLAQDLHLPGHPRCVIKQLKPQFTDPLSLQTAKRLFDTEAEVLYKLGEHPQIPRLLAHFEHGEEFYLAQELIVGHPMTHELQGQPWTEGQVVALLQDLLGVLTFVHQQNVIHRDIKPANLIRRYQDGRVVMIDFGAVKQATTQLVNPNSSPTQTISIGTQGYMPNEQLAGNPRFSSDIYAVGMIGIQALTGTAPRLLKEDPQTGEIQWIDLIPEVNPDLAKILETMVRYDFRARYTSAAEAIEVIAQLPIAPEAPPVVESVASADTQELPSNASSQGTTTPYAPNASGTPVVSPAPGTSRVPTRPLVNSQMPRASLSASLSPLLSTARQLETRKLLPAAIGLAAVGLLFIIIKPLATPQSSNLQQSSVSSPTPTASPSVSASGSVSPKKTASSASSSASPSASPSTAGSSAPAASPNSPAPAAAPNSSAPAPATDKTAQAADLLAQAEQLKQKQQAAQALPLYEKAIALDANSAEAHWGRCFSLNKQLRFAEAVNACDAALKLKADYPEALWSKGFALDQQKQHRQALALYEKAIALKPDFAEAWSNKGSSLLLLKRPNEAVAAFDQATRLKPKLAEAWNNRGAALWNLRRFDEAVASVDRAIQIQPNYQDALSLRQQMRDRLGR